MIIDKDRIEMLLEKNDLIEVLSEKADLLMAAADELGLGIPYINVSLNRDEIDRLRKESAQEVQWYVVADTDSLLGTYDNIHIYRLWGKR